MEGLLKHFEEAFSSTSIGSGVAEELLDIVALIIEMTAG